MERPRYIALTDIRNSGEVDDVQSMYRLLLYANELELEGLIVQTSCFLRKISEQNAAVIHQIIDAYAQVKPMLDVHAEGYPSAKALHSIVACGIETYGKKPGRDFATDKYVMNPGVQRLLQAAERDDPRPIYIGLWGGASTLAQAVWQYAKTHTASDLNLFLSKLRIYGISDQDNAAHWLRQNYGDRLFYIVTPSKGSSIGSRSYHRATWPGISGDRFLHGSEDGKKKGGFTGADFSLIDNDWIRANIQSVSSYGAGYPLPTFLTEGDTPSFLWLIPNGLNVPERPDFGGWGGRYRFCLPEHRCLEAQEEFPIWTNASDAVIGTDGKAHISPQATIWRWREDFQNDFAARMQWTATDEYNACSHPPQLGEEWHMETAGCGETGMLDLKLLTPVEECKIRWIRYPEIGGMDFEIIESETHCTVMLPKNAKPGTDFHVIAAVSRGKRNPMTRYVRYVVKCEEN